MYNPKSLKNFHKNCGAKDAEAEAYFAANRREGSKKRRNYRHEP